MNTTVSSKIDLYNPQIMSPLKNMLGIDLQKYEKKTKVKLTLNEVEYLEKKLINLRKYIGFKPFYKLYKKLNNLIHQKFFKIYNEPINFYEVQYTNNLLNKRNEIKRNGVKTNKYNYGDLISFNDDLSDLMYVNHENKLIPASVEYGEFLQLDKGFSNYVNDFKLKFKNIMNQIFEVEFPNAGIFYDENTNISIRYNDKLLKRLFSPFELPSTYQIILKRSKKYIINNNKKYLNVFVLQISSRSKLFPEIPLLIQKQKNEYTINLQNPKNFQNVSNVSQLFQILNNKAYVFSRIKNKAFTNKNK